MNQTTSQTADKPAVKDTPRAALTLQEKFVKLREAVPGIVQKQHSDGVKYKFAKIFDVYELLTPAMNLWGVNFDIVAETATGHTANGDESYYHNYEQQTKYNGPRLVWVYEADLTVRWTNADDPEDKLEVKLHAIGTNDGGPDKAKGSAWTYCLKYYLFEKFGIDQGEDDPDMKDHGNDGSPAHRPQAAQQSAQAAPQRPQAATHPQSAPRSMATPPQPQNANTGPSGAPRGLSDAQLVRMYKKAEAARVARDATDAYIAQKYGQQDPHNLTRQQYEEVCAALDEQSAAQNQP